MSKVLILDDRKDRKKTLLSDNELLALNSFEKNGVLAFQESLSLINGDLPKSKEDFNMLLSNYEVIAIHRSWLEQNGISNGFEEYISANPDKNFIIFSGGTSTTRLTNHHRRLSVNAGVFYSSRLIAFIQDISSGNLPSLLEFLYGKSWKLPLLLEYRNLLWNNKLISEEEKEEELRELIDETSNGVLTMDYIDSQIKDEILNYTLQ